MGVGTFLFEIFVKLGLSSAALDKGLAQTRLKVQQTAREVRKETTQARDATALLGRMFGVTLPAQVQKFAASVAPVRQLLAGAFTASIVAGFTVAIGVAVVKAVQWFNVWRSGSDVFGEIEKRLAGMTAAFDKLSDAQLRNARLSIRLGIAATEAKLARAGALEGVGLAGFGFDPTGGSASRLAAAVAGNREIKKLGVELDKLRTIEASLTGEVGGRNEEREKELRKVKEIKDHTKEMWDLVQKISAGRARGLSLLPELTPQGAIGEGGIFSFLRGLDKAEEAVFKIFERQTLQDIFTRGGVGKFADLDRDVKKVAESANLLKANFVQAFQAIGQDLENAIVHFKGFGNVMLSVLQEIQRALIRTFIISPFVGFLTKGLSAVLGGAFGGGAIKVGGLSFPPVPTPPIPRQFGGSAPAGRALLVGERGPEIFTPGVSGHITPNHALRGDVVLQIDARGADANVEFRVARAVRAAEERGALRAVRLQRELAMRRA